MANIITSVSDYLEKLKKIAVDGDSQLFYRGVSNEEYATPENNIPSIYRNKGWIENEDKMYYELVSRAPEEFKDCQNTFEYLVKMQHYGYPTRLLDITSNPLVALYFACVGYDDKDGQVVCFNIKKNSIRNYESDRVALVSTLSLSKRTVKLDNFIVNNIRMILYEKNNFMSNSSEHSAESILPGEWVENHDYWGIILDPIIEVFNELLPLVEVWIGFLDTPQKEDWRIEHLFNHVEDIIDSLISIYTKESYSDLIDFSRLSRLKLQIYSQNFSRGLLYPGINNDQKNPLINVSHVFYTSIRHIGEIISSLYQNNMGLGRYIYDIKKLRPHFNTNLIEASDMYKVHCVFPKQNNPRLIAQQGAFLLFGFNKNSNSMVTKPKINDSSLIKEKEPFIIPKEEKLSLLEELFKLGISESTLFPEIDNVTKDLKDRYAKD